MSYDEDYWWQQRVEAAMYAAQLERDKREGEDVDRD